MFGVGAGHLGSLPPVLAKETPPRVMWGLWDQDSWGLSPPLPPSTQWSKTQAYWLPPPQALCCMQPRGGAGAVCPPPRVGCTLRATAMVVGTQADPSCKPSRSPPQPWFSAGPPHPKEVPG